MGLGIAALALVAAVIIGALIVFAGRTRIAKKAPEPPHFEPSVAPDVAVGDAIETLDVGGGLRLSVTVETTASTGRDRPEGDYADFVDEMWRRPGVALPDVTLTYLRFHGAPERRSCRALMVLRGSNGETYVNVLDDGVRLTFNVMNGHAWERHGAAIEPAGFGAILDGTDPDLALAPKPYPATPSEALQHDHVATNDPTFLLGYRDGTGRVTYRIISRVIRRNGNITARCHLRWGARRQFLAERIIAVADGRTGVIIPTAAFLSPKGKQR